MRRSWSTLRRAVSGCIVTVFVLIILHRMNRENEKLYPGARRDPHRSATASLCRERLVP